MKTKSLNSLIENRSGEAALPVPAYLELFHLLRDVARGSFRWCLALLVAIACLSEARSQTVTLGTASFTGVSDQIPANWYWPMPTGVTFIYNGYGTFAGATRTETYTPGQWIAGVKTVKWHMETKTGGSSTVTVEDWWLGLDVNGNLRVLQIVQSGSTVFAASGVKTPPVFLPSKPANGQKWDFLGNTLTIESVMTSRNAPGGLRMGIATPGSPAEYNTYNAGIGLVHEAANAKPAPVGSGWTLRIR